MCRVMFTERQSGVGADRGGVQEVTESLLRWRPAGGAADSAGRVTDRASPTADPGPRRPPYIQLTDGSKARRVCTLGHHTLPDSQTAPAPPLEDS